MGIHEDGLTALDHLCDDTAEIGTLALGDRLKTIRDVMKGLVGSGVVSAKDIWTWLPVILKLIQELGPIVADIIKRIQDAIGKGQTAESFA